MQHLNGIYNNLPFANKERNLGVTNIDASSNTQHLQRYETAVVFPNKLQTSMLVSQAQYNETVVTDTEDAIDSDACPCIK